MPGSAQRISRDTHDRGRARCGHADVDRDPDEHKQRLAAALTAAGVDHVIETYPAGHGWVASDTHVHDPAATERHWQTLLALFARTLR